MRQAGRQVAGGGGVEQVSMHKASSNTKEHMDGVLAAGALFRDNRVPASSSWVIRWLMPSNM